MQNEEGRGRDKKARLGNVEGAEPEKGERAGKLMQNT